LGPKMFRRRDPILELHVLLGLGFGSKPFKCVK
jgi:hypothetical protein